MSGSKPIIAGIIPARHASTRLPGKTLVSFSGRPMIQRVVERCGQARRLDSLWVATDDERIARAVDGIEGNVLEHGCPINVVETRAPGHFFTGFSVDTPEDMHRDEAMLKERKPP